MTLSRRHKAAIALLALLAFLSQGAFAALGGHLHAGGEPPMSAEVVHTAYDTAHAHHGADAEDDGVVVHSGETACEESRACLCCIGSCASLLPVAAAGALAVPVRGHGFATTPFPTATATTSLYRPPIPA